MATAGAAAGADVEVIVHTTCPKRLRNVLECARDILYKELSNSSKKKLGNKKTIGIMSATLDSNEVQNIVAISGQGTDEWGKETVAIKNELFERVARKLKVTNITWAPLTYEHSRYRTLTAEAIRPEQPQLFAVELVQRLKNKVNVCPTTEELPDALQKSAHRLGGSEKDFSLLVSYYEQFKSDDELFQGVCESLIEYFGAPNLQSICRDWVAYLPNDVFRKIEDDIKRVDITSLKPQEVIDTYIEPYRGDVPEPCLNLVLIALGVLKPPGTTALADISVRCAEDNALECLMDISNAKNEPVKRIDWFSATLDLSKSSCPLFHKPLCPFCAVAFEPRAKQINTMTLK